jgi:paraquat-inducible protein B
MNQNDKLEPVAPAPPPTGPEAVVEEARGLPLVWIIPLVALLAGGWLAWKTLSEQGPLISLTFKEAYGLEAGKTKIKFKDIQVGMVETVKLSDDLSKVLVTARMDKSIAGHLGAESRFWVVKPQLGLSGVSGLDTLMAGNYIAVEFEKGKTARSFVGLEHAPKVSADTPGKSFTLVSESAASLSEGTPIYFRNIQAGRVLGNRLAPDKQSVEAEVFIDAPFDQLVRDGSRFWKTSAIDVSMGADGFDLKVGSLLSLFGGGIAFDSPNLTDPQSEPSAAGAQFALHKDITDLDEKPHLHIQTYRLYFDESVRGLAAGAPVEFRGIKVGTVADFHLSLDFDKRKVRIPVTIKLDPDEFDEAAKVRKYLEVYKEQLAAGRRPMMETMVGQGLRARLKSGNMLTGQLYVDLDFYPDEPPKQLVYGDGYPEIPTLPSVTGALEKNVTEIMAKLKALPLDKIGSELLSTVQGANKMANAPELKQSLQSLDAALKDVRRLAQTADKELVVLVTSMEQSLASVRRVVQQMEPNSPMAVNLSKALSELSDAARSIRTLTDYLDRHPEALLKGKSGHGGKP